MKTAEGKAVMREGQGGGKGREEEMRVVEGEDSRPEAWDERPWP